ncbi:Hypothetical predicted protein [Mytilus galloprovincialis]|uniref:Peptidase A2 domain-containing protein n=1 Tax=Mytilus galloprovincialis TaxID=29158 RepID=A0A8B6G447_MYTGA|nr:Hypothetical predicted protein [Mytilus galloprovincialis]
MKGNAITCRIMIDTGATVNILDKTHQNIGSQKLNKNDTIPLPYGGGQSLDVTGARELQVETKDMYGVHKFYVVKGGHGALIGYHTASLLGLDKIIQPINIQAPKTERYRSCLRHLTEYWPYFA